MTVEFRCPHCGAVRWLLPSVAKRRKVCSRRCRNFMQWKARRQHSNRLTRVMFVHGYTEAEALIFLKGWRAGRSAAMQAYLDGKRLTGCRVGSAAWENGRAKTRQHVA